MSSKVVGRIAWNLTRGDEGQREYKITTRVQVSDPENDGPQTVLRAFGLPRIGSRWTFGNDNDPWAFCRPNAIVRQENKGRGEPTEFYTVEQKFSTIPLRRCQDETIENPLLEPARVSGSFVKYTEFAEKDKDDAAILTSSHEIVRLEKDANRPQVSIAINNIILGLSNFTDKIDHVNDSPLWGLPVRTIKLSDVTWSRQLYGLCTFYYTRQFTFDINFNTFDPEPLDAGFKVRIGEWVQTDATEWTWAPDTNLDKSIPGNFQVFKDRNGENFPNKTLLDGNGDPLTDLSNPITLTPVELYPEANFLELGIPAAF